MSAVGMSPLLLFVLCLHLGGTRAIDSVLHLSASPVKGDPHALNLTWVFPTEGRLILEHGTPRYFSITYALGNRYGCHIMPNATEPSNRILVDMFRRRVIGETAGQYTLGELEPNSGYHVYVQTHTTTVSFPESGAYGKTGQKVLVDAPTGLRLVRNESNTTSLKFVWDSVPCTAGSRSSSFLAYRYSLASDENRAGSKEETTSPEVLVTGLKPYTQYAFRVQFKSRKGFGPYNENLYAVTASRVSLTQESEVATGETVALACKGWGSSSSNIPGPNDLILNRPEGKGNLQRSSTTVKGLVRINHFRAAVDGPNVVFTCTLHHEGVDEALAMDSLAVKLYQKPYLRTAPKVRMGVPSSGNATVTWLQWTADGGGDGPVGYQEVVWRRAGDLAYENVAVKHGSVSSVVDGLEPNAEYEFAVVLFRKGLPGPPNKAILIEGTTPSPEAPAKKSAGNVDGYHNLFGPETDNAIIAGVCGIFLAILILLSAIGVWCTNNPTPHRDGAPLINEKE